jgi:hypothetical protein
MGLRLNACASALAACALAACSDSAQRPDSGPDTTPGDAAAADGKGGVPDGQSVDSPAPNMDAGGSDGTTLDDSSDVAVATVDGNDAATLQGDDAGTADAAEAGPPPVVTPSVCATGASWLAGTQLGVSTAADDQMGAITPDELTIAWTAVTGTIPSVMVADRFATTSPFGTAMAVPVSPGFYAADKVALSPDGLRLVLVRSDYKSYGVIARTARGLAFAPPPQDGEFNLINSTPTMGELAVRVGDPMIGAHDTSFYYSLYGGGLLDTILESTRADTSSSWPNGAVLRATGNALQQAGPYRRRPTGIAADDRTLFYWDEVDSAEKVAWRPTATTAFDHFETLGASFRGAVPNATCDKLYYSAAGTAGGLDLFVATRQ